MTDAPHGIKFVKAEANGNDFLIVDTAAVPPDRRSAFARRACDRHRGIGADGVEFVHASGADIDLILFNADGGEAEISGNGTRCVVAFYARHGFHQGTLRTQAGPRHARVLPDGDIELDMGPPLLDLASPDMTLVSMGNPHCCVRGIAPDWHERGRRLESDPRFPRRTNVEFLEVRDGNAIEIRIFERGVGPTHSSGTGSCAAAVAAIANGWVQSPVRVISPGGAQTVEWAGGAAPVRLRGPARIVAEGVYFPSEGG